VTRANDSILVTPGSGATVATHLVDGKEYQVVILAGPGGHLYDTLPTYYYNRDGAAGAANQRTIDLFNASGSGVILRVKKLFLFHNQTAITGIGHTFEVRRTSAVGTGGTSITAVKADTANANVPAQVTARASATGGATEGDVLFRIATNPEETLPAAAIHPGLNWIPEGPNIQEPLLREGEGFLVKQITSNTAGIWHATLVVAIE
jgi:hypothetical protein